MSNRQNLATNKRLFLAISEFVNTGPTAKEWLRLKHRCPGLLPAEVYDLPFDYVLQCNRAHGGSPKSKTWWIKSLDLLRTGMWIDGVPGVPTFQLGPLMLQAELRRVWRDASSANELLPTVFNVSAVGGRVLQQVLGLTEEKGPLAGVYGYQTAGDDRMSLRQLMRSFSLEIDWTKGTMSPKFDTEFQRACYLLLKNNQLAKVCANSDCQAPYFIATRAIQRYCSSDCLRPIQKTSKLNWWRRVGKKRRAKKRKGE